jgi:hypothetical protein
MRTTCIAATLLAMPVGAHAAEVASFDSTRARASVAATWLESQQSATIVREQFDAASSGVRDAAELALSRHTRTLRLDVDIPVSASFALRARLPWVLSDVQSWNPAGSGVPSLATTNLTPDGTCFTPDCTSEKGFVPVPGRVLRGGLADPSIGFAWTLTGAGTPPPAAQYPTFPRAETIVGLDYTAPLATVMDPTQPSRAANATDVFPVGQGTHRLDFWVRGRRALLEGKVTPEAGLHYTLPIASSGAFDNCAVADTQLTGVGRLACAPNATDTYWRGMTGLVPSHRGGFVLGAAFDPWRDDLGPGTVRFGLQLSSDYISRGRTWSEVTDLVQRLTAVDPSAATDAGLRVDVDLAAGLRWTTVGQWGFTTNHVVTSEDIGQDRFGGGDPSKNLAKDDVVAIGTSEQNPVYDFRVDQPGRRLKVEDVTRVYGSTSLAFSF